jgi:transcription antitermination factor NusG
MFDEQTDGSCCWFALAVKPRFERAVARTLEMKGYEALLPVYLKQHGHGSQSRDAELPLFPGCVFCRFDVRRQLPVLTTPGAIQILGDGNIPIPLASSEITSLQAAIRAHLPLQPFPFVHSGQRVRIGSGSLAGIEGIVMSFKQTLRLVVSVTLLQKSVLLEIDRGLVKESECIYVASATALEEAQSVSQLG